MDSGTSLIGADLWMTIFKSGGMLLIVLGLMIGLLALMKRLTLNRAGFGATNPIKHLATHHVAPREKIIIIDVMGDKFLLGVTPTNITCLARLDGDSFPEPDMNSDAGSANSTGSSASGLMDALKILSKDVKEPKAE